jgi:hypothetical protein
VLVRGHGVASGPSAAYPYGSLERQRPIIKKLGLDLDGYFNGTLNIDVSPHTLRMAKPAHVFRGVEWTDLHPPEDFSFSRCRLRFEGRQYDGWVYYQHPETKLRHFHDASLIEVIAEEIFGIEIGDAVEVALNASEVRLLSRYTSSKRNAQRRNA